MKILRENIRNISYFVYEIRRLASDLKYVKFRTKNAEKPPKERNGGRRSRGNRVAIVGVCHVLR